MESGGKKLNTILLANSGCPPLLGEPLSGNSVNDRIKCSKKIDQILDALATQDKIKHIFFFARGPVYFTGTEPVTGSKILTDHISTPESYFSGLQKTVNFLNAHGKSVKIVSENPELFHAAEYCVERPFRISTKDCRPPFQKFMERQREYLRLLANIRGAELIFSSKYFCDSEFCKVFSEDGKLLYADDDHLSVAGSFFLARKLNDHLDFIH